MIKTDKDGAALAFERALGQLRQAYALLVNDVQPTWAPEQRTRFAERLIAPQITQLETLARDYGRRGDDLAVALAAHAQLRRRLDAIEQALLARAGDIGSASQARRIIFSVFRSEAEPTWRQT